jgi:ubiquinone/menaquinone biosynthesis C-methylase UbiE
MDVSSVYDSIALRNRTLPKNKETAAITAHNNTVKMIMFNRYLGGRTNDILDVGGGQGQDLLKFARLSPTRVRLFDISATSLDTAIERHTKFTASGKLDFALQVDLVDANTANWGDTPLSYDFVNAQFMLHYVRDKTALLVEVERVLRPGGTAFFSFPDAVSIRRAAGTKEYLPYNIVLDGDRYMFSFQDYSEWEDFVDVSTFLGTAEDLGFDVALSATFDHIIRDHSAELSAVALKHKVSAARRELDLGTTMLPLYRFVVLRKL